MTGCDEFQVLLEMQSHGALEASDTARLEQHVSGCSRCQRFKSLSQAMDEHMATAAERMDARLDWDQVGRYFKDGQRRRLHTFIAAILVALLGSVVAAAAFLFPLPPTSAGVTLWATISAPLAVWVWLAHRAYRGIRQTKVAVAIVDHARLEVKNQLREARIYQAFFVLFALAAAEESALGVAAIWGACFLYQELSNVRRLKRELKNLE
jgi:hypothetical protein